MTKDDIIKLAREAGFMPTVLNHWPNELERFANLVAAAEREACAQLVENMVDSGHGVADQITAAIRARGTT